MIRRPVFWIVAVALTALATGFSIYGFPLAFPLVILDLRMDRTAALEVARELAARNGWGPEGFRQAAAFDRDGQVQAFVELEAGGNQAFARMLEEGLYHPYRWQVRHFRPEEATETGITFTPGGEPIGFRERLPEDQAGPALGVGAARAIAEEGAAAWGVDLSVYEPVETSRVVRPSDRVDHSFVYERRLPRLGEGAYRLRLVVAGDRFTELTHFVEIPEAFGRRYGEMRSANDAVATVASVAIILVLLAGGCGLGLFFLLRQRWVVWKPALAWGLVVGALEAGANAGFWPLAWMEYDTAVSAANFALQQLALIGVQFVAIAGITALVLMAAESLTRRAFPDQIQVWKLWSPSVAASPAVLGRTVAGFLLVAAFAAYEVALYFVAHRSLGWWQPSDALSNPNLLASYVPWLTAVGISLRAGVTEECLFRAVPLASAALLGQRFGGRRYWILGALLLQAVLFGAAHANYPAQPAYARLVELILPALGWGVLYLIFGLLPCIVCHFAVDVVFIGLPIFASSAPGAWVHQAIIVLLTLVPIWVVLRSRLSRGRWEEVGEGSLNGAWSPPAGAESAPEPAIAPSRGLGRKTRIALLALGAVGVVTWAMAGRFTSEAPPVLASRGEASAAARDALRERGVQLGVEWRELSTVQGGVDQVDRFVWSEGGPETYRALLGRYLWVPGWLVRYARFEGDVAERAEEYSVWTDGQGRVTRVAHRLPEARPGEALEQDAARDLARRAVRDAYDLDPQSLVEVSAEPEKHPNRRDWRFVFRDPAADAGKGGEARIAVRIAGDEVADSYLFVHVPEEWQRRETDRATAAGIVRVASTTVLVLLFAAGAVLGIVRWSRHRFSTRAFFTSLGVLSVVNFASFLDLWPRTTAGFRTEVSFELQVGLVLAAATLALILTAAAIALNVGVAHRWLPPSPAGSMPTAWAAGAGLGALVVGLEVAVSRLGSASDPIWASVDAASALVPWIVVLLSAVGQWINRTALLLLVVAGLHAGTAGWSRRRAPFAGLALVVGLALAGGVSPDSALSWLSAGLATGAVILGAYVLVLRRHPALLPVATAVTVALGTVGEGLMRGFPGAMTGSVAGAIAVLILAWLWSRALAAETGSRGVAPGNT